MFINPDKKTMLKVKEQAMKTLIQHYISDEMNKEIFDKVITTLSICVKAGNNHRNQELLYFKSRSNWLRK